MDLRLPAEVAAAATFVISLHVTSSCTNQLLESNCSKTTTLKAVMLLRKG
jgi:hypothetical protein